MKNCRSSGQHLLDLFLRQGMDRVKSPGLLLAEALACSLEQPMRPTAPLPGSDRLAGASCGRMWLAGQASVVGIWLENRQEGFPGVVRGGMSGRWLRLFQEELAWQHGQQRRGQRRQLPDGLLAWGRRYLPHHFRLPPSKMHRWLAFQLDRMGFQRGIKLNVLAPRGSAKSTLVSLAYVLRSALSGQEPYIWIVSDTRPQACAHLENVKAELETNELLAVDYPAIVGRGPIWRRDCILLRNGVKIEALGTGQRMRGRRHRADRPTLIICDDLQNDSHMQSAQARQRSRLWFHGTLMKAGSPRTNVVHLATALHREALGLELHRTAGWISRLFQSICRWPENMGLWEIWESLYTNPTLPHASTEARRFFHAHQQAMLAGARVLWPEYEDLYTLMCMRAESGHAAFEREKQNSPINPELCEWPEEYFDDSVWFEAWPSRLRLVVMALDPSKGPDARRGDYSAFVWVGVDGQGVVYVQADLARRSAPEIVAHGVELVRQVRPELLGIESNQFQELFGSEFEAQFRREGLWGVRLVKIENQVNKQVRIRRLGPLLAQHRLRFKADCPSTRLLVSQLRDFPLGDYDDGPDALEMAVRLAAETLLPPPNDGLGNRLPVG
ncbi:MAG: phage terminase large subunit [Thermoguttaceae bacterium]|nr:phage terminase large subunit [Thermoguttaceae bacterium]MDW8039620.1 phage terminase large subunit [Thermoguttaceae bacterium]